MACYDCKVHKDAKAEFNSLNTSGKGRAIARLFRRLEKVKDKCKGPNELPIKVTPSGVWLFARSEYSGLVGVFKLADVHPRQPNTHGVMTILAIDDNAYRALSNAARRA